MTTDATKPISRRRYSKPPIVEAIIDIKVKLPQQTSTDNILQAMRSMGEDFFEPEEIFLYQHEIKFENGSTVTDGTNQKYGYKLRSKDGHRALRMQIDGFSFSHLAPYESWERLREDTQKYWEQYLALLKPDLITRVAIRCINKIDLPCTLGEMGRYLRIGPKIPNLLPNNKTPQQFFLQLLLPQPDIRGMLIINHTVAANSNPEFISVYLDFDLFQDNLEEKSDQLLERLETLHTRNNLVFDSCITDETKVMIC